MAKEDPSKEERRRLKKEKKEKKRLAEEAGVSKHKSSKSKDKDRSSRSKSKESPTVLATEEQTKMIVESKVPNTIENEGDGEEPKEEMEVEEEVKQVKVKSVMPGRPIGALVPFANPLADEKVAKKCFKGVRKAATHRTLKRGVKEVVKSLRKSAIPTNPSSSSLPQGLVILAADISPLDVISHVPVLCEDHSIPYVYVTSRAELGIAGGTKRPTSVVLVTRDAAGKGGKEKEKKKKDGDGGGDAGEEKENWEETYKGLVKVVERESGKVRI
ncbi:MAG: hypothetical protein Q9160_008683 [Pyrenula sp. 1 TL-2023]